MQKYFKIILSDRIKDSFIYLPSDVLEIINHNSAKIDEKHLSFNIIKLKLTNSEDDIFLANIGGIASKENCIEISQFLGKCLKIKNGDYAKITEINTNDVEVSDALQLEPLTHIDYKIIESNPDFFEENMLNQLLVAYANMVFPFVFPDNSVVHLKVISNKKNKPLIISQDCEVEIIYKHEEKPTEKEEDKKMFFQVTTKIKSLTNLSNNFQLPILYVPKSFLENNKIKYDEISQLIGQISLFKSNDLINKEKCYYNSIFSRLCDYQSLYKYYSNTNNYQNLIDQIVNKFPYYNSFWVNIKIDDEKLDSVRINEFYYKFNTIIFENDQVNFNIINFDFKGFNFNIYNELLIKHMTIEYFFNEKENSNLEVVEKLIQDLLIEFIQKNSFIILTNKFYFILDAENRELYQADSEFSNLTTQDKILVYINFNTNTNDFMNFLLKIGKNLNFSKYSSNFDNDRVFRSLIILNSDETVQRLHIKYNKEVKIFCHEYFQNKLNRHIFHPTIMSIFNNNSFYSLLQNKNLNFVDFHKNVYSQITKNMNDFFKSKNHTFLNFIFGQRLVGKTHLARYISNSFFTNKNNRFLLENEHQFNFSNEMDYKIKYINLNLLGLNVKVFKKYIKAFFDIQHEMDDVKTLFIIDGMNSLSSIKVNENGGGQTKEVINYLAFKILAYIKMINKKNKLCRNKIFVMMLINSVPDIPEVFKNSKFLYDINHLNFLEKKDCEQVLKILLKDEIFENKSLLNKKTLNELSEYTKCFVIEDFCRIYNTFQAREHNHKDLENKIVDILSNYTPINLDANKKIQLTNNFSYVGGLKPIKEEIYNTISLSIQFYEKFKQKPPIKLSSGILLYGPSGCGKTLLASCIQNEFKLNFFSIKGPEILNKYIGSSEARIREIFENAKKVTPCVIFFDEFDSIAPKRGSGSSGVTDRIVNQLLCYLDGIESREGVFVMAATSKPDLIDPAVLRPGRIEKILYCGFPTEDERVEILGLYLLKLNKDNSEETMSAIKEIAEKTENYSSADLQNIVNEAHLMAIHEVKDLDKVESIRVSSSNLINSFKKSKKSVVEADIQYFKKYNKNFREKIEEDTILKMREQRTTLY